MHNYSVVRLSDYVKELSIFTKNLIVYKSHESGKDRVHFKSLQPILERRMHQSINHNPFFNGKKSIVWQFLEYLISCGEIAKLDNGYYATLPIRNVILPISKSVLQIGRMKTSDNEKQNLSLAIDIKQTNERKLTLTDYRYDLSLKDWFSIFQHSTKEIMLYNEECRVPTKLGFKKIARESQINERDLYYIISYPPLGEMREYFIARKIGEDWQGEKVNSNLLKSQLSILTHAGYVPTYSVKELNNRIGGQKIFQIILSDFLPRIEKEQVYLFSLPGQINYCKNYYVEERYLGDFLYVLKSLNFKERDVKP